MNVLMIRQIRHRKFDGLEWQTPFTLAGWLLAFIGLLVSCTNTYQLKQVKPPYTSSHIQPTYDFVKVGVRGNTLALHRRSAHVVWLELERRLGQRTDETLLASRRGNTFLLFYPVFFLLNLF